MGTTVTPEDRLFDDIQRLDDTPARHAEADFPFLNRSAWPECTCIREELERWFARYPASAPDPALVRRELRRRFRSRNDRDHQSAFFELFLHELFLCLGGSVEVHPIVAGSSSRPDFHIRPREGDPFYLEAVTVSGQSGEEAAAEARLNVLYDGLNNLNSPNFFLGISVEGTLTEQPPAGPIRAKLEMELARLDPDQVAAAQAKDGVLDAVPHWRFAVAGCTLDFFPIAKSKRARGHPGHRPLGVYDEGARMIDSRRPIRDAIVAKGQHLSGLDQPLVVAVNALDWSVKRIDIMEALFGKETFLFRRDSSGHSSEPEMTRKPDGALTRPTGPRYSRISAVLITHQVRPWALSGDKAQICLYHNPFAERPLTADVTRLPRAIPAGNKMTWVEGEALGSLLGLPVRWPELLEERAEPAKQGEYGVADRRDSDQGEDASP